MRASDAPVKLLQLEGLSGSRSARIGFQLQPVKGMVPVCLMRLWSMSLGKALTFRGSQAV